MELPSVDIDDSICILSVYLLFRDFFLLFFPDVPKYCSSDLSSEDIEEEVSLLISSSRVDKMRSSRTCRSTEDLIESLTPKSIIILDKEITTLRMSLILWSTVVSSILYSPLAIRVILKIE